LDGPIGPPPQLQLHGQDGRIEQGKTLQPTLFAATTAENLELICILFILSILPSCRAFGLSLFAAHVTPLGLDAERPSRAWFRCRLAGRTKFRLASST